MKKYFIIFISLVLLLSGCKKKTEDPVQPDPIVIDNPEPSNPDNSDKTETVTYTNYIIDGQSEYKAPKCPELTWISNLDIPEYSGNAYVAINDNNPFFDVESLSTDCYETYYALDELGRVTLADAILGPETMSTGKRGSISSVKPTGWHTDKYSFVDGEALYNRCHLIAHYLSDENANPLNLCTGTRYMNDDGMNAVENMIGDFIKETGYHIRYRVTPVWTGNNLVCDGLLVEAYSIEDEGEGVCLNFFAYNVQPGVIIDYATGDNYADEGYEGKKEENNAPEYSKYLLKEDIEGTFILNVKKKKIHSSDCANALTISEKNREEYTGSYNELIEQGYLPSEDCNPTNISNE